MLMSHVIFPSACGYVNACICHVVHVYVHVHMYTCYGVYPYIHVFWCDCVVGVFVCVKHASAYMVMVCMSWYVLCVYVIFRCAS